MCGIAAVLVHPCQRSDAQLASIRDLFTRNLVLNEERGSEATGCAVVQIGGEVRLAKKSVPASDFVTGAEYRSLVAGVDSETTLILGHTRLPTKGDPGLPANNHPIRVGNVVGAHNGHVSNDDELFARWGLPRQAEVDSEIIFSLLSMIPGVSPGDRYLREVQPRVGTLQGQFTFLACDVRDPGRLLVLRHVNPLCLHYHRDWQALIFSSSYLFLRRAFGPAVVTEDLPANQLTLFAAETIPQMGNLPVATHPLYAKGESYGE